MSEHTPGPWEVVPQPDESWLVKTPSHHVEIIPAFFVSEGGTLIALGCREANARLIAAAPDLLEACKRLLSLALDEGWEGEEDCFEAVNEAKAAIAKTKETASDPETWDEAEEEARRRTVIDGKPWGVARNERGNPCVRLAEDLADPEDIDLS